MLLKKDYFDAIIPYRNTDKRRRHEGSVAITFSDKSDDLACSLIEEYYGDFNKIEHRLPKVLEIGTKIVEVINPLDKNQMSPYTLSRYGFHSFIDNTEILDVFKHEIIGFKIEVETNLTSRNPNLILSCEYLFPITYKFIHNNKETHRQYVFKHGGFKKNLTLDDYYFNQLFERWITGDGKTASLRRADFYREVSPPDQLSSLTQGTPIGRSDNPDGTNPHSALPNGDSSRNIGRPSPDSPNLKYRNLDRADAYGRKPSEGQDFGYVHDSGSGSARVIPYDSGFSNNSSALRKSAKNVPKDPKLWAEVQALAKGESDKPVVRGENSVNPVNEGKGFTTFPSAYANGWALAQYKRLGGGWKKESKQAGLIRPPKHLVDEVTEILTAGFANYWVKKQTQVESEPYLSISLEQITNLEDLIEDLDDAYMSVRLGEATFDDLNIALRGLRIATQELVEMFEGQIHPTLEKMEHILEGMSPNSVFEEPKKYKNEFMFLGSRTFGLISDLKEMRQQRVSHISDTSRRLYEREANKVKRFDKFLARPSQSTWVLQTEELGTLRVQVRESKGAKGLAYYRYNEIDDLHTITVRVFPNSTDLSEKELGKIKDYVRHELVHAMQKQMSLNFNVEQAGIPFQKRDMTYLQGHDYKEKELKDQYAMEGLDSDLVSIHALDDIEFYSRLLDEVVEFQKLNVSRHDLNQEVHKWVAKRRFFVSLKRFKRDNWSKAVGIFFDAVNSKNSAVRIARKWSEEYCKKKIVKTWGSQKKPLVDLIKIAIRKRHLL